MEYLVSAANIRAFNYGLKGSTDPALFKKVVSTVIVPDFKPKSGVTIQVKDDEPVDAKDNEEQTLGETVAALPAPSTLAGYRMIPAEFEKDDDTNHHIDVSRKRLLVYIASIDWAACLVYYGRFQPSSSELLHTTSR